VSQLAYAYALAAVSTLCWGVVVVPIKLTRLSGKLGIGISMLTGALATSILAGRELWAFASLPWTEIGRFALTGTLQFTLGCMLYYESIRRGSMSIAVPVTRLKPRKVFTGTWEQLRRMPLQTEGPFAEEIIRADRVGGGW
jgi:drug/metabolite transporter (DMT)-like permease